MSQLSPLWGESWGLWHFPLMVPFSGARFGKMKKSHFWHRPMMPCDIYPSCFPFKLLKTAQTGTPQERTHPNFWTLSKGRVTLPAWRAGRCSYPLLLTPPTPEMCCGRKRRAPHVEERFQRFLWLHTLIKLRLGSAERRPGGNAVETMVETGDFSRKRTE